MTDSVFIHGLGIDTVIGVNPDERTIRQTLVFDIDMLADLKAAGTQDDLNATLDYAAVSDSIVQLVRQSSYFLIEALAERVSELLLEDQRIHKVKIKITKPGVVPLAQAVGCTIERTQRTV